MKNTLREASMYYRKGKGVHASSLLKSFKVPSLLRPPVSPTCSKPLKKESSAHPRLPEKLSQPSSLSWKFILSLGAVPRSSALMLHPGLLPGLLKLGKILGLSSIFHAGSRGEMWLHLLSIKSVFLLIYLSFSLL